MRRIAVLLLLILTLPSIAARRRAVVPPPVTDVSLNFTFDPGFRVINATNPAAGVAPNGDVYLYYTEQPNGKQKRVVAADGITFGSAAEVIASYAPYDSRNTLMPDGTTWRRYQLDPATKVFGSVKSADGANFIPEAGTRYSAQVQDHGTIGVYDSFSDKSGGVVLLYIGDMFGLNNVRRAYSRDGGLTFTFDRGNVLGDDNAGGGGNSYVDEKSIRLADGRIRLFTMRRATIYSFISNDDGGTFTLETSARLEYVNFKNATLTSLNDPVCIRLPDGRYRVYVASLRSDNVWVIVSATSQ